MDRDQGIVDRVDIKEVQHQVVLHKLIQDQQVDNHLVETIAVELKETEQETLVVAMTIENSMVLLVNIKIHLKI